MSLVIMDTGVFVAGVFWQHMIEAALAAGAKTIIARDADLTVLNKPFGIRILTPRAWLATLSREHRRQLR